MISKLLGINYLSLVEVGQTLRMGYSENLCPTHSIVLHGAK